MGHAAPSLLEIVPFEIKAVFLQHPFVTEMEFKKRRPPTGVGDGFLNHIGVAEDEEAPLGAADCRVEELACGERAVGF